MTAELSPIELGPLLRTDAERCAQLEMALFPGEGPWPAAAFREELRAAHNHYFAARSGGELLGYAGIAALGSSDNPEAEVHTIGVDPRARGRGIGRLLLGAMLAVADARGGPIFLDVRCDNVPAIALYESAGFTTVGVRKNYYQPAGADAYLMRRDANPADDAVAALEENLS